MIATAIRLQEATREAVNDEMVMASAFKLLKAKDLSEKEFVKELYQYSAMLASITTTMITQVLLTEYQLEEMITDIEQMESLTKDLE